jgi:hypothetical protein
LAVAQGGRAGGGVEELLALDGDLGVEVLLSALGGAGFDAVSPIELGGPTADGAGGDADFSTDEGIAALGTELPVNLESL